MVCCKCGSGYMVDDSHRDIRVLKCWACGYRIYPGHPKKSGSLVCTRCGSDINEENALSLCNDCLSLFNIHAEGLKGRTYGESVCACGKTFMRNSPTQLFHSKTCRKRLTLDG